MADKTSGPYKDGNNFCLRRTIRGYREAYLDLQEVKKIEKSIGNSIIFKVGVLKNGYPIYVIKFGLVFTFSNWQLKRYPTVQDALTAARFSINQKEVVLFSEERF